MGSKKTIAVFDYKQTKKNAHSFLKKINSKKHFKSVQEIEPNSQKPKAFKRKENNIEAQIASYQKNRKYLTENYLDILKKLDNTNIVKWRVLNGEKNKPE